MVWNFPAHLAETRFLAPHATGARALSARDRAAHGVISQ
ncbi:hypothetical protein AARI_10100 [Glutamicibacter arilaitensis Re117]|uniref:Uncharacterized protein n=1 Tax=Glutamicibacter arilaitensis (strain DSM 16368 / CIP 108037 / IAM 15318 / JCM 13566 / NCIMB 14258 / Re117) TaxID=861360 RepID=A0ABP1U1K2_GLUAR|nr:hypothetical protein AARI_10100 [Glutamicibacter arilaitensis Re117]